MINKWLTISINPPKLDVKLAIRTADKFGYGCDMQIIEFAPHLYSEQEAVDYLATTDFIEWLELPL